MNDQPSSENDDIQSSFTETEDISGGLMSGAKLKAQLQRLRDRRIDQQEIRFPQGSDACEFFGGHATVTKGFMDIYEQYPESETQREGEEEKDGKARQGEGAEQPKDPAVVNSESISAGWTFVDKLELTVAVKKHKTGDNKDLEKSQRLALREAELLLGLDHIHVMWLEGFVEDTAHSTIWLVFPWCGNGNLSDFVASEDWEVPERISLIFDVSQGLQYLHTQYPPICHGDLKSMNILVDWWCRAVITDFGSARRITHHEPRKTRQNDDHPQLHTQATLCAFTNTITLTGSNFTTRWAAPEQLLSDGPAGLQCDIWALGWIAYEVMTNSIPFGHITKDIIVIQSVIQGNLPAVVDDPRFTIIRSLCSLITRCWKIEPDERPTAGECRQWMSWMPKAIPSLGLESSSDHSERRSPELLRQLGTLYGNGYDSSKALKAFTEALNIYTELGNKAGRADVLCGIASMHLVRSESDVAIRHYQEALDIWTELGSKEGRALALYGLGDAHSHRDAFDTAVAHYSEALAIFTEVGLSAGRAGTLSSLGEVHRLREEFDSAVPRYTEALQIYTELGLEKPRAHVLHSLGDLHRHCNEHDQAELRLSEALSTYTELGDTVNRAHAFISIGEVHCLRNQFDQALEQYCKGLDIYTALGNRKNQADALCRIAFAHRGCSEFDRELLRLSEALDIFIKLGDKLGRAKALYRLGDVHCLRDELDQAARRFSEALDIYTELGEKARRADALYGLGDVCRLLNEPDQATLRLSEALDTYIELGDKAARANTLRALGDVHCPRNELDQALSYYSKALGIYMELEEKSSQGYVRGCLALIHNVRGETDLAMQQYSAALDVYTELGNTLRPAYILREIAKIHHLRNELDAAFRRWSEALDLYTELGSKADRACVLCNLGDIYQDWKELEKAALQYSEALDIYAELDDKGGRCAALCGLAEIHHLRGENCNALKLYSEALDTLNEPGDKGRRGPILATLAKVHQSQGEYDQAVANCTAALQISLESGENDLRVNALQVLPEVLRLAHPNDETITVPIEVAGTLHCSKHGDVAGPCVVQIQIHLKHPGDPIDDFCQCVANRAELVGLNREGVVSPATAPSDVTSIGKNPDPEKETRPFIFWKAFKRACWSAVLTVFEREDPPDLHPYDI